MNNEIDLLEELEREERGERLAAGGGGAGAALGIFLTLLIGCGLVFAAYKLGQRKNVDEPPLIAAMDGPIKTEPESPGGSPIPGTDNVANAMIDGSRPSTTGYAIEDGIVVEAELPERRIDPAESMEAREIRREIVALDDLPMMPAIDGQPSLGEDAVPDRADERMMVAGAEIPPGTRPVDDVLAAAAAGGVDIEATGEDVSITIGEPESGGIRTTIASATDETLEPGEFGERVVARLPLRKPNLGPSVLRDVADGQRTPVPAARTPERPATRPSLQPAVASRVTPTRSEPGQRLVQPVPQVPASPSVRRVAIPPQPVGDAQVQLGAYPSANEVRGRWSALRNRHRDLLGPLGLLVQPVRTSNGQELFRMRVGPLRDAQMAAQLCNALRVRGIDCIVPQRR